MPCGCTLQALLGRLSPSLALALLQSWARLLKALPPQQRDEHVQSGASRALVKAVGQRLEAMSAALSGDQAAVAVRCCVQLHGTAPRVYR